MTQNHPDEPKLITTGDGSHTLYSNRFDQHYHNPNGAIAESEYVFFEQNGLLEALKQDKPINILEIGFGTGLNLLLLANKYLSSGADSRIQYHSIEAYPISGDTAASFNFSGHLQHPDLAGELPPIFDSLQPGMNRYELASNIDASIFYGLFENYQPDDIQFDFIFHDAFSPGVNPDLWSGGVFKKLRRWSHSDALLTTYSAASRVKGALAWAGWKVAQAPGALGKREMTVASPTAAPLAHLKRINEDHLTQRYEEDDF